MLIMGQNVNINGVLFGFFCVFIGTPRSLTFSRRFSLPTARGASNSA